MRTPALSELHLWTLAVRCPREACSWKIKLRFPPHADQLSAFANTTEMLASYEKEWLARIGLHCLKFKAVLVDKVPYGWPLDWRPVTIKEEK